MAGKIIIVRFKQSLNELIEMLQFIAVKYYKIKLLCSIFYRELIYDTERKPFISNR